jgi:hypothetical protein
LYFQKDVCIIYFKIVHGVDKYDDKVISFSTLHKYDSGCHLKKNTDWYCDQNHQHLHSFWCDAVEVCDFLHTNVLLIRPNQSENNKIFRIYIIFTKQNKYFNIQYIIIWNNLPYFVPQKFLKITIFVNLILCYFHFSLR